MIDNNDIAVAVQQKLRRADQFDTFLEALQELIDDHRGEIIPKATKQRRTARKVRKKRKKQRTRRAVSQAEQDRIVKMRKMNLPFRQIGSELNRAESVVRNAWMRATQSQPAAR
jgi:hypothetical protein